MCNGPLVFVTFGCEMLKRQKKTACVGQYCHRTADYNCHQPYALASCCPLKNFQFLRGIWTLRNGLLIVRYVQTVLNWHPLCKWDLCPGPGSPGSLLPSDFPLIQDFGCKYRQKFCRCLLQMLARTPSILTEVVKCASQSLRAIVLIWPQVTPHYLT